MYIYICIYTYTCIYIYIYIHIHVYIHIIYHIENNYMFRRLVMAIFRLYMEHFSKQLYKTYIWATYMGDLVPTLPPPYPI